MPPQTAPIKKNFWLGAVKPTAPVFPAQVRITLPPLVSPTKPSLAILQEEARIASEEAKRVNSFWGIAKNTVMGIPKATTNLITGAEKPKGMVFPILETNFTPDSIDKQNKEITARAKQLETEARTINLQDKNAVDVFNTKISSLKNDVGSFNKGIEQYNLSQNARVVITKHDPASENPSFMSRGYYDKVSETGLQKLNRASGAFNSPYVDFEERKQAINELTFPIFGASSPLRAVANGEGKASKILLDFFTKSKSAAEIEQSISIYKLPPEVVKPLSLKLANANTIEEVKSILMGVDMPTPQKNFWQDTTKRIGPAEGLSTGESVNLPSIFPNAKSANLPKTQFKSPQIRALKPEETASLQKVNDVISGRSESETIADIPGFLSSDGAGRSLLFNKISVADEIKGHGKLIPENLVINANDWDGVLKNVRTFENGILGEPNPNKINLIKKIPNSDNFLLIGADKQNGFFMLTHYEVGSKGGNELKSLLGRGELLAPDGTPLGPKDFLSAPPAQGSFVGVSGRNDIRSIAQPVKKASLPTQARTAEAINEAAERAKTGVQFGPRDIENKPVSDNAYGKEKVSINDVDKLIIEGKIRVVRRGDKDIFQYKKGKDWVNARDQDSAVFQVIREPVKPTVKVYSPEDRQKIDQNKAELENLRERLAEHPALSLLKFIDKKEGEFLDFRNPDLAKSEKEAARIRAKNKNIMDTAMSAFDSHPELHDKFDNADTIKDVIADYQAARKVEKILVSTKNDLAKNLKPISLEKSPQTSLLESSPLDTTAGEGRSIEILSNQALDILSGEPFSIYDSLPYIIENTMTNVKSKVNIIDTYLRTPFRVMDKIGFGKQAKMLQDASNAYWKELPKNIEKVSDWLAKLKTKEAALDVYRWLDGKPITLPPGEKEVAMEIRRWLVSWAKRLNLPEDDRISYYITHIFNRELIEKEFDEELAKIIADKIPGSVYDPFLLERLGKKGYIEDLGLSLDAYAKRATRKVHLDPVLEVIQNKAGSSLEYSNIEKSQFNYIKKYISNVNMRPSEMEEGVDNFIKSVIGYKLGQRPTTVILGFLRKATFRGMLGLNPTSALRNLSQGINTYAVLGEKYTAVGYMKLFNLGSGEELAREGILNAGFIQDRALSSTKIIIQKMDKVLFAFFDTAEKINRGAAYYGAKSKALSEGMGESEAINYAKEVVRKTQFSYDTINTPVGLSGDLAKTLLQFQTYTTKQLEFLAEMGKDRNFAGLFRYVLAGLAFVYTIGRAFGMEPKELLPWYRFDVPPSLKFPVEATKAAVNAPDKYGNTRTTSEKSSDVGKSAIGLIPAGSQIKKTLEGIKSIYEGGVFTTAGNLQFQQDLSTLGKARAILFGKYASPEAKNYFNRQSIKEKEQAPVRKIYDHAQELLKSGNEPEAQNIIDNLSDAEYEIYKDIRTAEKAKATVQGKKDIVPTYQKAKALKAEGKIAEAQAIVNALTDDEYKYYQLIDKQLSEDKKASEGEKPEFAEDQALTEKGLINTILTYAQAVGTDPATAFDRIFTGQRIRYVANGTIVVERLSLEDSQGIKEDRNGKTDDLKLDHLIPLQLGGSNAEDNLILVPTEIWSSYTPVENFLGQKLRDGEITKERARELITKFKKGEITAEEVYKN